MAYNMGMKHNKAYKRIYMMNVNIDQLLLHTAFVNMCEEEMTGGFHMTASSFGCPDILNIQVAWAD